MEATFSGQQLRTGGEGLCWQVTETPIGECTSYVACNETWSATHARGIVAIYVVDTVIQSVNLCSGNSWILASPRRCSSPCCPITWETGPTSICTDVQVQQHCVPLIVHVQQLFAPLIGPCTATLCATIFTSCCLHGAQQQAIYIMLLSCSSNFWAFDWSMYRNILLP